jgi:glutamate 5-kinase
MSGNRPDRVVVKVGTSTLTDADGRLDGEFIGCLVGSLCELRERGHQVVLVSSGAIRAGRDELERQSSGGRVLQETLPYKQAAAAVGQGLLMRQYIEAFSRHGVTAAQVLLTRDDSADRGRFLNARNTLNALLSLGAVPVVNENDTVAVEEIKFGDNDALAALVAVIIDADLLLILSDVDGLYLSPDGIKVIPTISSITPEVEALAGGSQSGVGTGGMRTKIEAARIATASGIRTVIARGRRERVIRDVVERAPIGTAFLPRSGRLRGRKRWIAAGSRPAGSVTLNARAAERLRAAGVSLLAAGIVEVDGEFTAGALIEVRDDQGRRFARGLTNYSSAELQKLKGLRSAQFEEVLGSRTYDEVVHRDNLVLEC